MDRCAAAGSPCAACAVVIPSAARGTTPFRPAVRVLRMIDLKFPDGRSRQFDDGVTGADVAASISPSLARKALLVKLDGQLRDLARPLERGGSVEIVTRDSPEALDVIRHDTSHVPAQAGQELFPDAQVTIRPNGDGRFYYAFARDE